MSAIKLGIYFPNAGQDILDKFETTETFLTLVSILFTQASILGIITFADSINHKNIPKHAPANLSNKDKYKNLAILKTKIPTKNIITATATKTK